MEKSDWIWMNGEIVPWDDAKVHVLTHGLHYGTGVFEGVRAYQTDRGPAIFRHRDHLERLQKSADLYYLELPYSLEELREATHEVIRRNNLDSCYIRPIAFRGYGEMGLYAPTAPVEVIVAVWPWGAYLGEDGKRNGIRAKVSSWRRISPDSLIPHA
ncbi:MAG TPA: aminotransferase class IV, partial [Solirubrobacterales bacterium]